MGLSELLAYITPQTAVGIAIVMSIGVYAFWKEWIVPGPRYKAALKEIERRDRRERLWQRLFMISNLAAEKAATLPQMELEMEECE